MPTAQLIKDLYMVQETANENLKIGSNLVRKNDMSFLFESQENDPDRHIDWSSVSSELHSWEAQGYIKILSDPCSCKGKDNCFQVLRTITAITLPPDLNDSSSRGSLRMTDLKNKKL